MKIAIVHDWLVTFAGAEHVLADMLKIWPHADLYSVIDFLSEDDRRKLDGKRAHTTFVQKLPQAARRYQYYLPLMPYAVEQIDLSGYDLVISSSHAVAKGVITGPDQLHICYCYSPMRYIWDMQPQYLKESGLERGLKGQLARLMLYRMRNWDYRSSNGVDSFVAISDYIGRRIKKVYRRESATIYPGVAVNDFTLQTQKEDFYLTASRMVPYKKMELIARAFAAMPDKKLVIIGAGPQYDKVTQAAAPNVQLLGHQPFAVLKDYMQRARAFIFAAEEDFGIVPIEAQACGTPVIAYGKGGALETVADQKTGLFFEEQTEASLQAAVHRFEAEFKAEPEAIRQHALQFSSERFREEFRTFVEQACIQHFAYRSATRV